MFARLWFVCVRSRAKGVVPVRLEANKTMVENF